MADATTYYILGDIKASSPGSMYNEMERDVIENLIPFLVRHMPTEESKKMFEKNLRKGLSGVTLTTL